MLWLWLLRDFLKNKKFSTKYLDLAGVGRVETTTTVYEKEEAYDAVKNLILPYHKMSQILQDSEQDMEGKQAEISSYHMVKEKSLVGL